VITAVGMPGQGIREYEPRAVASLAPSESMTTVQGPDVTRRQGAPMLMVRRRRERHARSY
jgi:hypothetical protein